MIRAEVIVLLLEHGDQERLDSPGSTLIFYLYHQRIEI